MNLVLRFRAGLLLMLVGGLTLTGCASRLPEAAAPTSATTNALPAEKALDGAASMPAEAQPPRALPQLVKTATLELTVKSVQTSIDQVKALIQQQQGDLLELQDQAPTADNGYHRASVQLRVPQTRLEAALQALKALGTVQNQSLTAEDVSNQLVDYQARLRNLRRSEETLLEIMGRSGSVGDVLKVSQELSNVRNSIEQISAQLQQLQNQVAYSTINLSLQETVAAAPPARSVQTQLQDTWAGATHSLGAFTVDLLQLGIWLLVYSPYWLLLAGGAILVYRSRTHRPTPSSPHEPPVAR